MDSKAMINAVEESLGKSLRHNWTQKALYVQVIDLEYRSLLPPQTMFLVYKCRERLRQRVKSHRQVDIYDRYDQSNKQTKSR